MKKKDIYYVLSNDTFGSGIQIIGRCLYQSVVDFSKVEKEKIAAIEDVLSISESLIKQNIEAYKVLAK